MQSNPILVTLPSIHNKESCRVSHQPTVDPYIRVRGAKEHNLKNVDIDIPKEQLVVITGLSGSGKSSLAFDTIYAEGQRRYVESLSSYARQFLNIQDKPDVESITGLSPAIAIDQKTTSKNPRSTVGTVTEVYDYLRLLYARIGIPYSPATGLPIESQTVSQMVDRILELPEGTRLLLLAPVVRGRKGEYAKELLRWQKQGFQRVKIDGLDYTFDELPKMDKNKKHDIEIVVDRVVVKEGLETRLADSMETILALSEGLAIAEILHKEGAEPERILFSSNYACPVSGFTIDEIEPRLFSFNSPFGACKICDGLGTKVFFDPELVVPDHSRSLVQDAIAPWANTQTKYYRQTIEALARQFGFSATKPWKDLPEDMKQVILYTAAGTSRLKPVTRTGFRTYTRNKPFEGVIPNLTRKYNETESDWVREELGKYQDTAPCDACEGFRLNPEALSVKVNHKHIGHICANFRSRRRWNGFRILDKKLSTKHRTISEKVLKEIRDRLGFLNNVGLGISDARAGKRHAFRRGKPAYPAGVANRLRPFGRIVCAG